MGCLLREATLIVVSENRCWLFEHEKSADTLSQKLEADSLAAWQLNAAHRLFQFTTGRGGIDFMQLNSLF
jgi:hypothetical protein